MQNNYLPGGILSIVSGVIGIIWGVGGSILSLYMFRFMFSYSYGPLPPAEFFWIISIVYAGIGSIIAILGILAIVGGVYALKKRRWRIALAGSIASTITFFPCGIAAVIFISMGKEEFRYAIQPAVPIQPAISSY